MRATVRPARREDSAAAAAVVRAVYEEFGFAWEPDGYHADLADVEAGFDAFWVAELDGRVVGCAGIASRTLELPWRSGRTSCSRTRTGCTSAPAHASSRSGSAPTRTRAPSGASCSTSD